ncbi:SEC-C metal-binding domain-containing protein [Brevibacillus fluminis]|uniref:SEC-C metal-binding domain-containing protein n=1 Tax=Brevibacillus fluminis TaxID=511487 RepID=UPI003F8A6485
MGKQLTKSKQPTMTTAERSIAAAACLGQLTKHELTKIRMNWGLKGASSLKKDELVAALCQALPDALPAQFNTLDETGYRLLKRAAERGRITINHLSPARVDFFAERGLLFWQRHGDKMALVMPTEAIACFKAGDSAAYREKIRANTEWIKLAQGLVFYYGCLETSHLIEMVQRYSGMQLSMEDCSVLLKGAEILYDEIQIEGTTVSNVLVDRPQDVLAQHRARPDLDYYPFSKAQLLQAGEPGYEDRNASFRSFVQFIKANYQVTTLEAEELVGECVYDIQLGVAVNDIMAVLQSQLEIDDIGLLHGFMGQLAALNNDTRQWALKGYTPNELSSHQPRHSAATALSSRKVGRNDPCPCGSGKKFKKCCQA